MSRWVLFADGKLVVEHESGELRFMDHELSDGGFFTRDNHPKIPPPPILPER